MSTFMGEIVSNGGWRAVNNVKPNKTEAKPKRGTQAQRRRRRAKTGLRA